MALQPVIYLTRKMTRSITFVSLICFILKYSYGPSIKFSLCGRGSGLNLGRRKRRKEKRRIVAFAFPRIVQMCNYPFKFYFRFDRYFFFLISNKSFWFFKQRFGCLCCQNFCFLLQGFPYHCP